MCWPVNALSIRASHKIVWWKFIEKHCLDKKVKFAEVTKMFFCKILTDYILRVHFVTTTKKRMEIEHIDASNWENYRRYHLWIELWQIGGVKNKAKNGRGEIESDADSFLYQNNSSPHIHVTRTQCLCVYWKCCCFRICWLHIRISTTESNVFRSTGLILGWHNRKQHLPKPHKQTMMP